MTQDEEIISAAILHDTIEDCEGVDAKCVKRDVFSKSCGNRITGKRR